MLRYTLGVHVGYARRVRTSGAHVECARRVRTSGAHVGCARLVRTSGAHVGCARNNSISTLPDDSQAVTPDAIPSRKRRRTNAAAAATSGGSGGADALEAITRYMVAKQKTVVPESETEVFARHVGN